jgi:hypothetical protein
MRVYDAHPVYIAAISVSFIYFFYLNYYLKLCFRLFC